MCRQRTICVPNAQIYRPTDLNSPVRFVFWLALVRAVLCRSESEDAPHVMSCMQVPVERVSGATNDREEMAAEYPYLT